MSDPLKPANNIRKKYINGIMNIGNFQPFKMIKLCLILLANLVVNEASMQINETQVGD